MENEYGKVKITDNGEIKEVSIVEYMQATFKDNRVTNVCELENGAFILSVENVASSGRGNHSMLLTKESLFGLMSVMTLFINKRGFDFESEINNSLANNKDEVFYSCSKNLI